MQIALTYAWCFWLVWMYSMSFFYDAFKIRNIFCVVRALSLVCSSFICTAIRYVKDIDTDNTDDLWIVIKYQLRKLTRSHSFPYALHLCVHKKNYCILFAIIKSERQSKVVRDAWNVKWKITYVAVNRWEKKKNVYTFHAGSWNNLCIVYFYFARNRNFPKVKKWYLRLKELGL